MVAITAAALAILVVVVVGADGPILATDEIGYLGAAVELSTRDATPHLAGTPLYPIGFPLVLAPLLSVTTLDPWLAAVGINVVLTAVLGVVVRFGATRLLAMSSGRASLVALVAVAYPTVALQAGQAWVEVALLVLVTSWAVASGVALHRPGWNLVAVGALGAGAYVVHNRTFPLLVVAVATVLWCAPRAWRAAATSLIAVGAAVVASEAVEQHVIDRIYGGDAGPDRVGRVFDGLAPGELLDTLVAAAGHLWYLQIATLGLAGVAVGGCIAGLRPRRWRHPDVVWRAGLLVAFGGVLLISASTMRGDEPARVDPMVYGRYVEVFVPTFVLVASGLLAAVPARRRFLLVAASGASTAALAGVVVAARGLELFSGNVQKLTVPGLLAPNLLGGGAGRPFAREVAIVEVTAAAVAGALVLAAVLRRRLAPGLVLVAGAFATSAVVAAAWSLGPFARFWADLGDDLAASAPAPSVVGVVASPGIAEGRNLVLYEWGFPDVEPVPTDGCPEHAYVLMSTRYLGLFPADVVAEDEVLGLALVTPSCS